MRQPRKDEPDSIEWPAVKLQRDSDSIDFPLEQPPSHYYAGRRTDSDALLVGDEIEKFLFYRGVGRFQPPVAALVGAGDRIVVRNLGPAQIPAAILFQNHDGKISYRVSGPIGSEVTLEITQAAANTGRLRADMESILISQGLFAKGGEGDGCDLGRLLVRGRDEIVLLSTDQRSGFHIAAGGPAGAAACCARLRRSHGNIHATMKRAIRDAIARGDSSVFAKYGRFLNPVTAGMEPDAWWRTQAGVMRQKYLGRETACGKSGW